MLIARCQDVGLRNTYLELQKQLWKTKAQAKQKWLEQSLAQPTRTPDDAQWRVTWIKQALKMVKRAQVEIKYHAALMDAYTEHLTVLEMTLIAGAEQKLSAEAAANPSAETPPQKRSTEAAANLSVETPAQKRSAEAAPNLGVEGDLAAIGGRPGDSLKRKHA